MEHVLQACAAHNQTADAPSHDLIACNNHTQTLQSSLGRMVGKSYAGEFRET